MQLRTFTARDMREALVNVRAEMGDDAIIVASEKTKSGIVVRAALDRAEEENAEAPVEETTAEPETIATVASFEENYRDGLIKRLRGTPQANKTAAKPFHRTELLSLLGKHRLPDALAHDLAKTAEQSLLKDMTLALACALDRRMKSAPLDISKTGTLLLLGPNGVGKTALAAKIAAHARLAHRHVLLISTDAEGAGALPRLEAFADHLRLKVEVAGNAQALAEIVAQCRRDDALAIVDTAGFDPRNAKVRTAFQALAMIDGIEALGVVSATADAEETQDIIAALNLLGAQRIAVTGLDLPRRFGTLTAAACSGLGVAHITRSPFVAAGLETLTPLALARMLIESASRDADQGSTQ
jgi:flagellar biosynthesis protein FlhF